MLPLEFSMPDFVAAVADALDHLWDYPYLCMCPLVDIPCIQRRLPKKRVQRSHLVVGRIVSEVLLSAINDLRPGEREPRFSKQRVYHTILAKTYVERIDRKRVADSLGISMRTYYRQAGAAIQVVARVLGDWCQ